MDSMKIQTSPSQTKNPVVSTLRPSTALCAHVSMCVDEAPVVRRTSEAMAVAVAVAAHVPASLSPSPSLIYSPW